MTVENLITIEAMYIKKLKLVLNIRDEKGRDLTLKYKFISYFDLRKIHMAKTTLCMTIRNSQNLREIYLS